VGLDGFRYCFWWNGFWVDSFAGPPELDFAWVAEKIKTFTLEA